MKGGHVLWVVERDKAVKACLSNKALSIGTAGSITPVDIWTIKKLQHREWGKGTLGDQTLAVAKVEVCRH